MDFRALIFIPALVGAAICTFVFLTFAAHYYLTILESTAAGAREVQWVPETITDHFWKPFYLAWLLCLWLGPAYIVGRTLAGTTGTAGLRFAVPVLVAWVLFPVSQLSSLSASSVWIPLHPQVFARLGQKFAVTVGFLVLTLPVFALGGIAFQWSFLTDGEWYLLFVGVPLMVLAGFLYARLLGRLAFALMFTRDLFRRKKRKRPKSASRTTESPEEPDPVVQPSKLPPISTPDGELAGYNVLIADDAPAPKKRVLAEVAEEDEPAPRSLPAPPQVRPLDRARTWTDEDEDAAPYAVNPSVVNTDEPAPVTVLKPTADELALLDRSGAPKPLKRVWSADVLVFLGQLGTISAMVILCAIGVAAGIMVRVARQFNPTVGE